MSPLNPPMTSAQLLALFDQLPDLLAGAGAKQEGGEIYGVLQELEDAHLTSGRAYLRSMPFRSPPRACSSGEHRVPVVQHRIVVPALRREATLSEAILHEVRAHGGELPEEVAELLRDLATLPAG